MTEPNSTAGKGKAFYDQADQVAETGNWDYAIEMYREGIAREPENLERGLNKLWAVALARTAQGGKGPGWGEKSKHKPVKDDPFRTLANAAFLLAKEPGNFGFKEQVLKAAWQGEVPKAAHWIAEIMLSELGSEPKPNRQRCLLIADAMEALEFFDESIQACNLAKRTASADSNLDARINALGAKRTIQAGKYDDEDGDFTKGVKDIEKQKEYLEQDSLVKTEDYKQRRIRKAQHEYEEDPSVPGKIDALVDALAAFEDEAYENQAIDVLDKAYKDLNNFRFKMRIGDIRIRQMTRRFRKLRESGDKDAVLKAMKDQLAFEIEEFRERVANYPTDLGLKFELGRRLYLAGADDAEKYDEAIGYLQQAQRDPRRQLQALNFLGQAFMAKEWWQEAIDTFEKVLATDIAEDRVMDIRYNLGGCLEHLEQLDKAEQQFSRITQVDFNFKDARHRLEAIRKRQREKDA